eukprot:932968-Ditylum_brightwellii.AAC.1
MIWMLQTQQTLFELLSTGGIKILLHLILHDCGHGYVRGYGCGPCKSSIDYIPGLETDISELDVLLSATELHYGLEHEMRVQRLLLSSIEMTQSARYRNGCDGGENNRDEGYREIQRLLVECQSQLEDVMLECLGSG